MPPATVTTCPVTCPERTGVAEEPGRRADEDERALPVAELREEPARREECRRQVRVERLAPPRERKLRDGNVLRRPHARDGGTDVQLAGLGEHPRDVLLVA